MRTPWGGDAGGEENMIRRRRQEGRKCPGEENMKGRNLMTEYMRRDNTHGGKYIEENTWRKIYVREREREREKKKREITLHTYFLF